MPTVVQLSAVQRAVASNTSMRARAEQAELQALQDAADRRLAERDWELLTDLDRCKRAVAPLPSDIYAPPPMGEGRLLIVMVASRVTLSTRAITWTTPVVLP